MSDVINFVDDRCVIPEIEGSFVLRFVFGISAGVCLNFLLVLSVVNFRLKLS